MSVSATAPTSRIPPCTSEADRANKDFRGNREEAAVSLLRKLIFAAVFLVSCPWSVSQAGVYLGVGFGGPYYRPYGCYRPYGWGYGGFYRPYGFGVVVAPPPVVVGGPP